MKEVFNMFGKKKQNKREETLDFKNNDYKMKDIFDSDNLVVANLEYISSEATPNGPMVKRTTQKYLFELIYENDKIRYREIFTGFIADTENHYFDLPYVVNIVSLKEQEPTVAKQVHKYGLLLVLNEINTKKEEKELTR